MSFPAAGGRRSARSVLIRFPTAAVAVLTQDLRNGHGKARGNTHQDIESMRI